MIVGVYGAGYVGLVSAACLAKLGHYVICADINQEKINRLKTGECTIYEETLPDLIKEQLSLGRLSFTTQLEEVINTVEIHLIATGTPQLADGSADLSQVLNVVKAILSYVEKSTTLVIKSTVPVGTGDRIETIIKQLNPPLAESICLEVASNPEFLREGSAVHDFFNADRVIIGGSEKAISNLERLYTPLVKQGIPLVKMSRRSAELVKYAANTMLASKISLINYFSQLSEAFDANIDEIREGLSYDHRIGPHFLQAGIGYGGSCFPKDLKALRQFALSKGINTQIIESIEAINLTQKNWVLEQLSRHFCERAEKLKGLKIGIWGVSFKPGTEDMREASSGVVIPELLKKGVQLRIYDPIAMPTGKKIWGEFPIKWCNSAEEVFGEAFDALIILTEWTEFKQVCLVDLKKRLKHAPLIDGRNCFDWQQMAKTKITYYSVGRPLITEDKVFQEGRYENATH